MMLDNSGSDVNCFDFRIWRLVLNKGGFCLIRFFSWKIDVWNIVVFF